MSIKSAIQTIIQLNGLQGNIFLWEFIHYTLDIVRRISFLVGNRVKFSGAVTNNEIFLSLFALKMHLSSIQVLHHHIFFFMRSCFVQKFCLIKVSSEKLKNLVTGRQKVQKNGFFRFFRGS